MASARAMRAHADVGATPERAIVDRAEELLPPARSTSLSIIIITNYDEEWPGGLSISNTQSDPDRAPRTRRETSM